MADQTATDLLAAHPIISSTLADNDVFALDDTSAVVTGGITAASLRVGMLTETGIRTGLRYFEKIAPAPTGVTATDTAALQAFLNGLSAGDVALFGPSKWVVNATLTYPELAHYVGTGQRTGMGTWIQQANGANLDAVIASELWMSASATPTSDAFVHFEHFYIDGNRTNQTAGLGHGLVVMNFQSTFEHLYIGSCRGTGMVLTSQTLAGNAITNSCNEIKVRHCQFRSNTGNGFWLNEANTTAKLTDGGLFDCEAASNSLDGFKFDAMAGWTITEHCHAYSNGMNGINAGRMFRTQIIGNYVESYGGSGTAGTYAGINAQTLFMVTGQNIIANNTVHNTGTDVAANTRFGIVAQAANGQGCRLVIAGNTVSGQTGTIATVGLRLSCQDSAGVIIATVHANQIFGWDTDATIGTSGTIKVAASGSSNAMQSTGSVSFSATPTFSSALAALRGGMVQMTLTASITSSTMTDGVDGQEVSFVLTQDATGGRTIAWPTNFDNTPTAVTTANGVTAGTFKFIGATSRWRRF